MFLDELKDQTSALHRRLDRHPMLASLTQPELNNERYATIVAAFFGMYQALEPALESAALRLMLPLDLIARRKLPSLRADLSSLGIDEEMLAAWESPPTLPDLETLLGWLYVVEGSTLGAQVICHHLKTSLGIDAGTGGAFFAAYGRQETYVKWSEVRHLLASHGSDATEQASIIEAARQAFEAFESWMDLAAHRSKVSA